MRARRSLRPAGKCRTCGGPIPDGHYAALRTTCSDECRLRAKREDRRSFNSRAVKKPCERCGGPLERWKNRFCAACGPLDRAEKNRARARANNRTPEGRSRDKERRARAVDGLSDKYIRELMWPEGRDAPQELIELKRAEVMLRRLILNGDNTPIKGPARRSGRCGPAGPKDRRGTR